MTPQEEQAVQQLMAKGDQLPSYLQSLPLQVRFYSVGLLHLKSTMPDELLLALLTEPESVQLQIVDGTNVETHGEGWYTGAEAAKLAKTVPPMTPPTNDGIVERVLQQLRGKKVSPDRKQAIEQLRRISEMARIMESMGFNPGPVLGQFGLDWPPGSGNFHGGNPPSCGHNH